MAPISDVLFTQSEKRLATSLIFSNKMSFHIDIRHANAQTGFKYIEPRSLFVPIHNLPILFSFIIDLIMIVLVDRG